VNGAHPQNLTSSITAFTVSTPSPPLPVQYHLPVSMNYPTNTPSPSSTPPALKPSKQTLSFQLSKPKPLLSPPAPLPHRQSTKTTGIGVVWVYGLVAGSFVSPTISLLFGIYGDTYYELFFDSLTPFSGACLILIVASNPADGTTRTERRLAAFCALWSLVSGTGKTYGNLITAQHGSTTIAVLTILFYTLVLPFLIRIMLKARRKVRVLLSPQALTDYCT